MWKQIIRVFVITLVSWSFVSLSVVEATNLDEYSSTYQQVIKKLEGLTPGETIDVRMGTEKDMYKEGEPLEIRFLASEDSYITLMAISTDGSLLFLVPSRGIPDTRIKGGKVYSTGLLAEPTSGEDPALYDFGMKIRVAPPQGIEVINLFCSTEKVELFEVDFEQEPVYEIKPDDEERLKALFDRLDQFETTEWAGTSVQIFINMRPRPGVRKFGALPPIGSTGTTGKFFPPIGSTGTTGKQ
jgi:hypothetical protein